MGTVKNKNFKEYLITMEYINNLMSSENQDTEDIQTALKYMYLLVSKN